jgi:hypothetical protein
MGNAQNFVPLLFNIYAHIHAGAQDNGRKLVRVRYGYLGAIRKVGLSNGVVKQVGIGIAIKRQKVPYAQKSTPVHVGFHTVEALLAMVGQGYGGMKLGFGLRDLPNGHGHLVLYLQCFEHRHGIPCLICTFAGVYGSKPTIGRK